VEYQKSVSELEVDLDWYTNSRCRHLYRWNPHRQGQEKGRDAVHEPISVDYYCARSQSHQVAVVRPILILSWLCGHGRDEWCKRWYRNASSSGKDTVDNDPFCVGIMTCCNSVKMQLDGLLATHIDTTCQVIGNSCTSIYFFQKWVLQLWYDFSHPPSHVCKVFNRSLYFNISWISKWIWHQHSGLRGNCFEPSQDPPTPIAWCVVITLCYVSTLHERCIVLIYPPSDVVMGYKN